MRILIATDGSDFSRAAIEKGCQMIIKPQNAAIKIVSVFEEPAAAATEPFMGAAEYYQEMEKAARKQAEEYAARAASLIREYFPNSNIDLTTQAEMGSPKRRIIEIAEEWNADLIIVGSHGQGFWGRVVLGSVSDAVVHNAPCSVLVARRNSPENARQ